MTVDRPCWYCEGTGTLPPCDHWWVPNTSGQSNSCGYCGQPENWTAPIVSDGDGAAT